MLIRSLLKLLQMESNLKWNLKFSLFICLHNYMVCKSCLQSPLKIHVFHVYEDSQRGNILAIVWHYSLWAGRDLCCRTKRLISKVLGPFHFFGKDRHNLAIQNCGRNCFVGIPPPPFNLLPTLMHLGAMQVFTLKFEFSIVCFLSYVE